MEIKEEVEEEEKECMGLHWLLRGVDVEIEEDEEERDIWGLHWLLVGVGDCGLRQ